MDARSRWSFLRGLLGGCLLVLSSIPPVGAADGLTVDGDRADWPRWQARLGWMPHPSSRWELMRTTAGSAALPTALLGDYDLGSLGLALPNTVGRLRATSGMLFGARGLSAGYVTQLGLPGSPDPALASAPYLGLGYTGWLAKSGLSFSADLGLSADYPGGTWRFGRALFGTQGVEATLREIRLQPRLQLGVRYRY